MQSLVRVGPVMVLVSQRLVSSLCWLSIFLRFRYFYRNRDHQYAGDWDDLALRSMLPPPSVVKVKRKGSGIGFQTVLVMSFYQFVDANDCDCGNGRLSCYWHDVVDNDSRNFFARDLPMQPDSWISLLVAQTAFILWLGSWWYWKPWNPKSDW